jgi:4-amino-4-deoxy-L-arabinose transferase-like glycosyltransferase
VKLGPSRSDRQIGRKVVDSVREHRLFLLVSAAMLATLFLVPTLAPIAIWDDWVYALPAEKFAKGGELRVLDAGAAGAVFQIVWGSLFIRLMDDVFGPLRLSVVVLVLLSGWAFYGLLAELRVRRSTAAFGTAIYWFNPLAYVLTFTFMTDAPYMALSVIATYSFVRALGRDQIDDRWLLAGSVAAGVAYLIRQLGVVIPLGVLAYAILSRRVRFSRRGLTLLAEIVGPFVFIVCLHLAWLLAGLGTPVGQRLFTDALADADVAQAGFLLWRVSFMTLIYLGLLLLPIAIWGFVAVLRSRRMTWRGWILVAATSSFLVIGQIVFLREEIPFPYAQSWFSPTGLGPANLVVSRPEILKEPYLGLLAWVGVAGALIAVVLVARGRDLTERSSIRIVLMVGAIQAAGLFLPAFYFNWILDRYLLPLFPFAIAVALWALTDVRPLQVAGWCAAALFAIVAVAGTRDFLVFESEIWAMARQAVKDGVPLTKLDAGAAWDGYHLWELSRNGEKWRPGKNPAHPWWIPFWDLQTDSTYVVSGQRRDGFTVVRRVTYSQWLNTREAELFLLRRQEATATP